MIMNLLISVTARCIAIKPNPPVPTITTLSSGLRVAFLTAPYCYESSTR